MFVINSTFEIFLKTIDQNIPAVARALPVGVGGGELSIRKHYRIAQASEAPSLASYLATDVMHVHSAMTSPSQDPGEFYSRHQHVAEMVFNRVLPAAEDRFDLLARVLRAINVDYSSDRETFSRLIRGRGIAEMFSSADLGRLFYDRVQEAAPNDPFVSHQGRATACQGKCAFLPRQGKC